jgi:hypothetical protein
MSYASAFEEDMVGLDVVRAAQRKNVAVMRLLCTPDLAAGRVITAGFR